MAGAAFADVSATTPSISRVADGTTSEPWTPMLQDSQIAWSPSLESPAVQRVRVGAISTVSDSQPLAGQLQRLEKWRYAVNSDAADSVGGGQPSSSLIDDDTRGPALRQPAKSMDETKVPPNLFGVDTSAQSRDGTIPASTPLSVSARPQRLFQFDSQPSLALGIHLRVKLIKKNPFFSFEDAVNNAGEARAYQEAPYAEDKVKESTPLVSSPLLPTAVATMLAPPVDNEIEMPAVKGPTHLVTSQLVTSPPTTAASKDFAAPLTNKGFAPPSRRKPVTTSSIMVALFGEDEDEETEQKEFPKVPEPHVDGPPLPDLPPSTGGGFLSASGKKVNLNPDQLERAKRLMQSDDDAASSTNGFVTPAQNKLLVSSYSKSSVSPMSSRSVSPIPSLASSAPSLATSRRPFVSPDFVRTTAAVMEGDEVVRKRLFSGDGGVSDELQAPKLPRYDSPSPVLRRRPGLVPPPTSAPSASPSPRMNGSGRKPFKAPSRVAAVTSRHPPTAGALESSAPSPTTALAKSPAGTSSSSAMAPKVQSATLFDLNGNTRHETVSNDVSAGRTEPRMTLAHVRDTALSALSTQNNYCLVGGSQYVSSKSLTSSTSKNNNIKNK